MKAVEEVDSRSTPTTVVAIACDGLSSDCDLLTNYLIGFLLGRNPYVGVMDPNHAMKSFRSQLVVGKNIVNLGTGIFDVGLFAGIVNKDVVRIRDFASDKLVHEFCSPKVIRKLLDCSDDIDNVSSMVFILFCMRIFLVALNNDDMRTSTRLELLWISLITFTSLEGVSKVTIGNSVRTIVAIMCLVAQREVLKARSCTTEFLEYFFGHVRSWRREFTVDDLMNYYTKLERVFRDTLRHDLRTAASKKGYMHGFAGYAAAIDALVAKCKARFGASTAEGLASDSNSDDSVDVDYTRPVGPQLERLFIHTQYTIRDDMETLIVDVFKCKTPSKFLQPLDGMDHLAAMIMCYMPATYRGSHPFIGHVGLGRYFMPSTGADDNDSIQHEREDEVLSIGTTLSDDDEDVSLCLEQMDMADDDEWDQLLQTVAEQHVRDELTSAELIGEQLETMEAQVNGQELRNLLTTTNKARLSIRCSRVVESIDILSKRGTTDVDDKAKSLQARWWTKSRHINTTSGIRQFRRNMVFEVENEMYRVLALFKKSYNKWRIEDSVNINGNAQHWVHLQKVHNTVDCARKKSGSVSEVYLSCDLSFLDKGRFICVLEGMVANNA